MRRKSLFPNHRRGISATLGVLSHDLTQFRRWAEGGEVASILFVEENNLSPAQRSSILATVTGHFPRGESKLKPWK